MFIWPDNEPLPFGWEWPKGVPRDYKELARDFEGFVAKATLRYNKVGRNFEDILQEVWQRLVESQVLEKFVESAARRLPSNLTVGDALAYWGFGEFQWFQITRRKKWLPKPSGGICDLKAVYTIETVIDIDNVLAKVPRGRRLRPTFTSAGFRAYLQRAVHNAYANYCRTVSRRYKEQLLRPQIVLTRQSSGCYRQVAEIEDMSSWENSIAEAMTLDEEETIDLMGVIRKARLDLSVGKDGAWANPETAEVVDYLVQQGKSDDGPQRNMEVITYLGQGHSLAEAVKRMHQRVKLRERQRLLMG